MDEEKELFRIGRVTDVTERLITAELDPNFHAPPPPFGSLVRLLTLDNLYYGLLSDAQQGGRRRPSPLRLSRPVDLDLASDMVPESTTFRLKIILLGSFSRVNQKLVPNQGKRNAVLLHALVLEASESDVQAVAIQPEFLEILMQLPDSLHASELIVASLRRFSNCFPDPVSFLSGACRNLSRFSRNDQTRVSSILKQVNFSSDDARSKPR